jgi:hypothetical protein
MRFVSRPSPASTGLALEAGEAEEVGWLMTSGGARCVLQSSYCMVAALCRLSASKLGESGGDGGCGGGGEMDRTGDIGTGGGAVKSSGYNLRIAVASTLLWGELIRKAAAGSSCSVGGPGAVGGGVSSTHEAAGAASSGASACGGRGEATLGASLRIATSRAACVLAI